MGGWNPFIVIPPIVYTVISIPHPLKVLGAGEGKGLAKFGVHEMRHMSWPSDMCVCMPSIDEINFTL